MRTIAAKKNQEGFFALMSVIIMSAVLLLMVVTAAALSFRGRFNMLDYENKKISVGLAEACVQVALAKLAENTAFTALNVEVVLETGKVCRICSITGGPNYVIKTRAAGRGNFADKTAFTNVTADVTFNGTDFVINSLNETPSASNPSACVP